jgi:hypothetical protein
MAVAAHQMQASQHAQHTHGYPGSHVSSALLHNYSSSSPMTMSGLASGSHHVSPAASSYNLNGLMNHPSPYAAAAAAAGHPLGSASSSPGNTPGLYGDLTDMRNGLAGPTAPRKTKYTRSRTGCLACRVKRVKCDETRPVCKRCVGAKRDVSIFPCAVLLATDTLSKVCFPEPCRSSKSYDQSVDGEKEERIWGHGSG